MLRFRLRFVRRLWVVLPRPRAHVSQGEAQHQRRRFLNHQHRCQRSRQLDRARVPPQLLLALPMAHQGKGHQGCSRQPLPYFASGQCRRALHGVQDHRHQCQRSQLRRVQLVEGRKCPDHLGVTCHSTSCHTRVNVSSFQMRVFLCGSMLKSRFLNIEAFHIFSVVVPANGNRCYQIT